MINMDIGKFISKIGKTIVSIEVNPSKVHWQVVHKLTGVVKAFEQCLTTKEKKNHGTRLTYLKDCLHNAEQKICSLGVKSDMQIAVFENVRADLQKNLKI